MILSNEFAKLYDSPIAGTCIQNAINIFTYCSEGEFGDPLAGRLLFILKSFRDVVDAQQEIQRIRHISNSSEDPISNLFPGNNNDVLPPIYINTPSIADARDYGIATMTKNALNRESESQVPTAIFDVSHPTNGNAAGEQSPAQSYPSPRTMQPPHILQQGFPSMFSSETGRDGSTDVDSLGGDAEIDFDAFWTMPIGAGGSASGGGESTMPVVNGDAHDGISNHFSFGSVQSISDSMVPLYGVSGFGN